MSGTTASLRFPGQLKGDLRKLGVNLVPFPRLHFFATAQFPLFQYDSNSHTKLTIPELTKGIMDRRNYYVDIKPASIVYRGDKKHVSTYKVENEIMQMQDKFWEDFVDWIPNAFKTSVINVPMKRCPITSTFVCNHTGITQAFDGVCKNSKKLLKKQANITDLVTEYQDKEHVQLYDLAGGDDENVASGDDMENENENENEDVNASGHNRIENISNRTTHTHTCTSDHQYVNKNIHSFEFNYDGFEVSESTLHKIRINNLSLEQQSILQNVSAEFIQIIEHFRAQNIRLSKPRATSIENLELEVKQHQQAVYKCREELQDAIGNYKQCNKERKTLKQQQNECEYSIANKLDHNRKCFLF